MNAIAEKIIRLMNDRQLSYGELSKLTKIPKSALQRYATGGTEKIPLDRLESIASALCVTPAYLMGWEDAEIKTEEDEKNAKVIIFEGGSMFDLDKLPDGTKEDLKKIVQILPYETADNDFKLQVIIDKEEILNLDALPLDKKKDLMKYIRFLLSDEK